MSNPPVRGCSCFLLRRLTRRITRHYDLHLGRVGLTVTQYGILSLLLDETQVQTIGTVAARMDMDRTSLTRTLKPMLVHGWITVIPEGRQKLIELTPLGRTIRMAGKSAWRAAQEAFNTALGIDQVAALHQILDIVDRRFHLGSDDPIEHT